MKKFQLILFVSGLYAFLSCGPNAFPKSGTIEQTQQDYRFPQSSGAVNDLENILSEEEEKTLATQIEAVLDSIQIDILLVTTDTIQYYKDMKNYAHAASKQWGRGHVNNPDGVTMVVSKKMREARVSTGDSVFAKISDEEIKKTIDNAMAPEFANNRYYEGIQKGVKSICEKFVNPAAASNKQPEEIQAEKNLPKKIAPK